MSFTDDSDKLRQKLADLTEQHGDLDSAICALIETGINDQIKLARLKKRKLALKDEIIKLQNQITPDIIA